MPRKPSLIELILSLLALLEALYHAESDNSATHVTSNGHAAVTERGDFSSSQFVPGGDLTAPISGRNAMYAYTLVALAGCGISVIMDHSGVGIPSNSNLAPSYPGQYGTNSCGTNG